MDNRGMPDNLRYLVMEKLGIDLENYRLQCGGTLSEPIVLRLAYQMISRFQHVHEQPSNAARSSVKKLLYRDTKPNNFMLGWDSEGKHYTNQVHLIDFGLSTYYEDPVFKNHIPQRGPSGQLPGFAGTQRYASRNALNRLQQGRRDDMETLGYVWGHLFTGALPWAGMKPELEAGEPETPENQKKAKYKLFEKQVQLREHAREKNWTYQKGDGSGTSHMLPFVLKQYMRAVFALDHESRPDYESYLQMIRDYAQKHDINLQAGFLKETVDEDGRKKISNELQC